jgi:hypothetical protein
MPPSTMALVVWSFLVFPMLVLWGFLVLPILGQYQNFRHNCSTPELSGTILTAPCREMCSHCRSFYVSSIGLDDCLGYDGQDQLVPQKQ